MTKEDFNNLKPGMLIHRIVSNPVELLLILTIKLSKAKDRNVLGVWSFYEQRTYSARTEHCDFYEIAQ